MTHPGLVEAMADPRFYPHRPDRVELVQTHISYIFIAGDLVFKVKKAVDFGFLDFTTLEKRRYYCREELRLNRRLAPEAYLEVVAVREDGGRLFLGMDTGDVVEYAVKMVRLPRERMLKRLLAEGRVTSSVMDAVAKKIADFHATAETGGKIDEIGGVDTVRRNHEENFEQTRKYIGRTIRKDRYDFIEAYVFRFMESQKELLHKRVRDHRIRDCHGDLHLEHICLTDGIVVFDCIEFNERFRFEDVAAEVAFLAMDLDFNGYPDFGDRFAESYCRYACDPEVKVLLNFYKCYYAYVRGKVTSFRSDDEAVAAGERWEAGQTASRYFDLAYRYAARPEKPVVVVMTGLMGTGKSVLAGNLAPLLGAEVIRTDVLRKDLLEIEPTERRYEAFGQGIYSEELTEKTYEKAIEDARRNLREGRSVIVDASFRRRRDRMMVRAMSLEEGVDFFVLECVCPEEVIKKRLDARINDREEPSDGRWELFAEQKRLFEPVEEYTAKEHAVIDTSGPTELTVSTAIRRIRLGDES